MDKNTERDSYEEYHVKDEEDSQESISSYEIEHETHDLAAYHSRIGKHDQLPTFYTFSAKINKSSCTIPFSILSKDDKSQGIKFEDFVEELHKKDCIGDKFKTKKMEKKYSSNKFAKGGAKCQRNACHSNYESGQYMTKSNFASNMTTQTFAQGTNHSEKMTYCRPATNVLFNQEFIYKTIERNIKLQLLLKKLLLARKKETHNDNWNNYINELKNKHGTRFYESGPGEILTHLISDDNAGRFDDYPKIKYDSQQSHTCDDLLQDLYNSCSNLSPNNSNTNQTYRTLDDNIPSSLERSKYCFPTTSQRYKSSLNRTIPHESFRGNTIYVEKRPLITKAQKLILRKPFCIKENKNIIINSSAQTDTIVKDSNEIQDPCKSIAQDAGNLNQKTTAFASDLINLSFTGIENKLDSLIKTINSVLVEIRAKKLSPATNEYSAVSCTDDFNKISRDIISKVKQQSDTNGNVNEGAKSADTISCSSNKKQGSIEDILIEEIAKSDKFKRDIDDILSKPGHPCAVQITIDTPTKERSTEITNSLCARKSSKGTFFFENPSSISSQGTSRRTERTTMAVNTDPLGISALIRVSTETMKQILSYVPNIDYSSYLARLSVSHQAQAGSHFVCNVCGATFSKPSQLSDHIRDHNLGNSRNCCVCRHVLDMKRHRSGLFSCEHCGQVFTRAYCCELHQQTCPRRPGNIDTTPSLKLLS